MKKHFHISDLHGIARLAVHATVNMTDIVEAVHHNISQASKALGVTGFVYDSIRGVATIVRKGLDFSLKPFAKSLSLDEASKERNAVISAMNGVIGDHLATDGNSLAISMSFRYQGKTLELNRPAISKIFPEKSTKLVILVHGLCMGDLQWNWKDGHDHGDYLAKETGFTQLYLRYNSGLHISSNGRAMSAIMEDLLENWPYPLDEMVFVCHSMGGLVTRSAFYYAQKDSFKWPKRASKIIFLGTPHHGAPMERAGNRLENFISSIPFAGDLARLGRLRSAGITDLRFGNITDEDLVDDRFSPNSDKRKIVPLPQHVKCYTIAASTEPKSSKTILDIAGDGLVPVTSALGWHKSEERRLTFPKDRQVILYETGHLDLLAYPKVAKQLEDWIKE